MARDFVNWEPETNVTCVQDVLNGMQHSVAQWELELQWVKSLHEKENVALQKKSVQQENRS